MIEFGMLAPIFFALMFGIIEAGYYTYMTTSFQRAVERAVYDLRTDHARQESIDNTELNTAKKWYTDAICRRTFLPTCRKSLKVTVTKYDANFKRLSSTADTTKPDKLDFAPRQAVMRVEAEADVPGVFTKLIFGKVPPVSAGITFMTEP